MLSMSRASAGRGSISGDDQLGIITLNLLPADLILFHLSKFGGQVLVMFVAGLGVDVQRVQCIVLRPRCVPSS